MGSRRNRNLIVAMMTVSAIALVAFVAAQSQAPTPVVVRLDKSAAGVTFRVDSRIVSATDLLDALGRVYGAHGAKYPVVVLLDRRLAIAEIWNVYGTAAKVPLDNMRFFVFDPANMTWMNELKWGHNVPFSTNPGAPAFDR